MDDNRLKKPTHPDFKDGWIVKWEGKPLPEATYGSIEAAHHDYDRVTWVGLHNAKTPL